MTVTSEALDMLAGDPVRVRKPGDFHRHPTTGAPYVTHPTKRTTKVMYGRPSSFGSALDNPYSLVRWKERKLVEGIARQPDAGGIDLLNLDDRHEVDGFIAYAYDAAETSLAADRGTHIHLLLEHWDRAPLIPMALLDVGERLGIPTALQIQIVHQWAAFRERMGLTALAVEQTVVNDRWRLAGTLDRLDVTSEPILTAYGVLDGAFVGDIKTGGLTVGSDGQPNYWVKYPVQLAAYVDAVPYDTDTDEREPWIMTIGHDPLGFEAPPDKNIALIYHYDLARALAGEVVDWQAIPVNVQAGREGGDLCRAAADFGKRRDLFAMPAPVKVEKGINVPPIGTSATIAVPVSPVTVEQPAVDPRPDTASPPVVVSAADPLRERVEITTFGDLERQYIDGPVDRSRLTNRLRELVVAGHADLLRRNWPEGVPTLKHEGHNQAQLELILAAVRRVEAEVGAGWHPDDSPEPRSAKAIRRAVDAWAGRDPGTAWFAASLIATFEQCRNADSTFEDLVASFTIEQADRLYDAATSVDK